MASPKGEVVQQLELTWSLGTALGVTNHWTEVDWTGLTKMSEISSPETKFMHTQNRTCWSMEFLHVECYLIRVKVKNFKCFSLKMLCCKAKVFPVGTAI